MPDDEPVQPEADDAEVPDTMSVRRRKRRSAAPKPVPSSETAGGETTPADQPANAASTGEASEAEKPASDNGAGAPAPRKPRRRRAATGTAATKGTAAAPSKKSEPADAKPKKVRTPPHIGEVGRNVRFAAGQEVIYGNQYTQVGFLVDMWADLIPGYADKAGELWVNYEGLLKLKLSNKVNSKLDNLQATGLFPPVRTMHFVRRNPVTVTVYIATQAEDLYLSWRAFVQTNLSLVRIGIIVAIGILAGVLINLPGVLFSFRPDLVGIRTANRSCGCYRFWKPARDRRCLRVVQRQRGLSGALAAADL